MGQSPEEYLRDVIEGVIENVIEEKMKKNEEIINAEDKPEKGE